MKKRKFLIAVTFLVIIFLFCSISGAQNVDLNNYSSETFSNLTKALGTLLGNGLFHTAAVHTVGGFDVGVKSNMVLIAEKYRSGPLKDVKFIPLPLFQANFGLLENIEIGGRYMNIEFGDDIAKNISIYTGILKYGVFQTFGLPRIALSGAYSKIDGIDDFSFSTLTFSGVVSKGFLLVDFYGGVGYNIYILDAQFEQGGIYSSNFSKSYKESDLRYTLGVNLGLIPFTKVNIEYSSGYFKSITVGVLLSIR